MHCINNGGREICRGGNSIDELVMFLNWRGKAVSTEDDPVVALGLNE